MHVLLSCIRSSIGLQRWQKWSAVSLKHSMMKTFLGEFAMVFIILYNEIACDVSIDQSTAGEWLLALMKLVTRRRLNTLKARATHHQVSWTFRTWALTTNHSNRQVCVCGWVGGCVCVCANVRLYVCVWWVWSAAVFGVNILLSILGNLWSIMKKTEGCPYLNAFLWTSNECLLWSR